MENSENVIYQGEFYKLNESRKRLIGTKSDSWKLKYVILYHKGEKPVLEYHKKKPKNGKKSERTLTDFFELWPSYKVEKLHNARGRPFVCEITSTEFHIFLSADEEKLIDILAFFLQIQIRLKDNIKKDCISVVPDDSECQHKIGATGSKCVLHASPWGLTLVLEQTRSLLAQWPLKSIRYYEASGAGSFSIEAGRVAPMGEGVFSFKTRPGDDGLLYDLVDGYIVNTLDRVKPTQRGTPEEIEDYIREHDCLHSLTTISVCLPNNLEIQKVLKRNWNISTAVSEESSTASSSQGHSPALRHQSNSAQSSQSSSTSRPVQSSSLVINLERPEDVSGSYRNMSDTRTSSSLSHDESRVTDRPPPLPSRSSNGGGVPRRSQRRDHSIPRKADVAGTRSEGTSRLALSESILPGSLIQPVAAHLSHSSVIHSTDSLPTNTTLTQPNNAPHHTEFYNLSSPNIKVRVTKSPIITRNPNKVGRAEHLMSLQQSGVKSPVSDEEPWDLKPVSVEDDHREAAEYLDAVAKASQSKYGGQNSVDHSRANLNRDLSTSSQSSVSDYNNMGHSGASSSVAHHRGYINLETPLGREIIHSRQKSAPETVIDTYTLHEPRQMSRENERNMSPSLIRHLKQRSATDMSHALANTPDTYLISDQMPQSAGSTNKVNVEGAYQNTNSGSWNKDEGPDVLVVRTEPNTERKMREFSGLDTIDAPVGDWLMSASCEDLSDHMRTVIYDDSNNGGDEHEAHVNEGLKENGSTKTEEYHQTFSSSGSVSSSEKPPLPFTGLKKFLDHTGTSTYSRDRSKSFGYMNIPFGETAAPSQTKPQSSAPSAHLIRKMVNARAKQETLKKSLSNPNYLNLGSKEHLFPHKSVGGSTAKLAPQHKQKSKSFGSLFPAIKKALSRESLGQSRSTTPERRTSRSTTPERRSSFGFRRHSNDADSNLKRQNSFHSYGEMTIKGIRMTVRSRSFRRVRGTKSMELLSKTDDETDFTRQSSTVPAAADVETQSSSDESNRASAVPSITESSVADLTALKVPVQNPTIASTSQTAQSVPNLSHLPPPAQTNSVLPPQRMLSDEKNFSNPQLKSSSSLKKNYNESSFRNTSSSTGNTGQSRKSSMQDSQQLPTHPRKSARDSVKSLTQNSRNSSTQDSRKSITQEKQKSSAQDSRMSSTQIPQKTTSQELRKSSSHEQQESLIDSQRPKQQVVSDIVIKSETNKTDSVKLPYRQPKPQLTKPTSSNFLLRTQEMLASGRERKAPDAGTSYSSQKTSSNQALTVSGTQDVKPGLQKLEHNNHTSEYRVSQNSVGNQRLQTGAVKTTSSNDTDNNLSDSKPEGSTSKIIHKMPSPFQPIPFKKHQNRICSVQAPSSTAKS